MGLKTPLYDKHIDAGARIVDFGGWDMPVNYGSAKGRTIRRGPDHARNVPKFLAL